MTKPTKILRASQFAGTIALYAALTHTHAPWWIWATTIMWGLVTGAWGFSAGWDARQ
nr:hypothetical protein [Mycobacterium sp. UM_NZ2]